MLSGHKARGDSTWGGTVVRPAPCVCWTLDSHLPLSQWVHEGRTVWQGVGTFLYPWQLLVTSPDGQNGKGTPGPPGPHLKAISTQSSPQAGEDSRVDHVCGHVRDL